MPDRKNIGPDHPVFDPVAVSNAAEALFRTRSDGGEQAVERDDVEDDEIEVHWQHPRHQLENPVLLVWPMPLRENWAAEIVDDRVAVIVSRTVLWEDNDGEIRKHVEPVDSLDTIPGYVSDALLEYDSEYGPVDHIVNPVNESDEEPPNHPTKTLEDYFNANADDPSTSENGRDGLIDVVLEDQDGYQKSFRIASGSKNTVEIDGTTVEVRAK